MGNDGSCRVCFKSSFSNHELEGEITPMYAPINDDDDDDSDDE